MIKHSDAYAAAVVDDSRRQYIRAVFDLIDPDTTITSIEATSNGPGSRLDQIADRGFGEAELPFASLEPGRWLLDGAFDLLPRTMADDHYGWQSGNLSGSDGTFETETSVEVAFSEMTIMQAVTMGFSETDFNGFPVDFVLGIYTADGLAYERTVTNNTETSVVLDGFTVNDPVRVKLTITRWNLPGRRARIPRLLLGLYERWDGRMIKNLDIYSEVTFSGLKIPYSTCTVEVYNENHRFDPYSPNTIFTSVEDRQAITVELGMRLADGSTEWIPGGTYFQQSAGWKLNDLTVEWSLLDIIGMLTKRRFVVPDTLPTTVSGWLQAIMASVGSNFTNNYIVDSEVGALPLTAKADDVTGKTCGELLRFLCMSTNTWPHQDFPTGNLIISYLPHREDGRITLDNMNRYPTMSANDDVATITFKLDDNAEVTFPGNNTESEVSLSVSNPFVHTNADAQAAAVSCLFEYGGRSFDVSSRGNPSTECGDILSIDTQFLSTITARLYKQQLKFDRGTMTKVTSNYIQSPNDSYYTDGVVLTGSGSWVSPYTGTVKVVLVGGGTGGQGGGGGNLLDGDQFDPEPTQGGEGGDGGNIVIVSMSVTQGQSYAYNCGTGGTGGKGGGRSQAGFRGTAGTDTTFADKTSADGQSYVLGYMDVKSGSAYGQKGGDDGYPVRAKYGTGGTGGKHGQDGKRGQKKRKDGEGNSWWVSYIIAPTTDGTAGLDGLEGCVVIEW